MHKYLFLFDTEIYLYAVLNVFSFFPFLIFNICHYKQKQTALSTLSVQAVTACRKNLRINTRLRFLKSTTFWTITEIILLSCIQYFPMLFLTSVFSSLFKTGSNFFGYLFLLPLLLHVIYWLIGLDPRKQSDLTSPAYPLILVFTKIGCFFAGCCNGIESNAFGMYNHSTFRMEIPVQLIESGCALLIFIVLCLIRKKVKSGTIYPLYMILFSAARFCSEFLRSEDNILGPLKKYHIFCLVGIVFGIIQYIIVCRYGEQLSAFIGGGLPALIGKLRNAYGKSKKKKKKQKQKQKQKSKKH